MNYEEILTGSPVRKILENTVDTTVFELNEEEWVSEEDKKRVSELTAEIRKLLRDIDGNQDDPLRIVVLGELKAGKSTFINACVGREVAYTDVTEATAAISEISYGSRERFEMVGQDGKILAEGSLSLLLETAEEKAEEPDYWKPIRLIRIQTPVERFKNMIFVDTPGLLTVTRTNEGVTKDYMSRADSLIWVINSKDLGNQEVNELIRYSSDFGKPMAAVINKVDSPEERESIEGYIRDIYESYFQDIFFLSARAAFRGITKGDSEMTEAAGLSDVLGFLEILGENAGNLKEEASREAAGLQFRRERDLHVRIGQKIRGKKQAFDGDILALDNKKAEIHEKLAGYLDGWIKNRFFKKEQAELSRVRSEEEFERLFLQYSKREFFEDQLKQVYEDRAAWVYGQWNAIENQLIVSSGRDIGGEAEEENYGSTASDQIGDLKGRGEDVKRGVKTGAAVGAVWAGWAAWVGPSAASVTLGSALVTIVPPLAVTGGVVAFFYIENGKKEEARALEQRARDRKRRVEELYNGIRPYIAQDMSQVVLKQLDSLSKHYYQEIRERVRNMEEELHFFFEDPDYSQFMAQMDTYLKTLDEEIERLEADEVPGGDWEIFRN